MFSETNLLFQDRPHVVKIAKKNAAWGLMVAPQLGMPLCRYAPGGVAVEGRGNDRGRLVQTLACLQSTPARDAEDKKEKGDFRVPISRFFRRFMSFFLYCYIAEHHYFRNHPISQIYP